MVPFPRDWLRSLIRGTFDDVFIARGEGDSMQPTLLDGDIVIIDKSQDALTGQDRIWCVSYGDLGMIKRLRAQPDRGILVLSDNPAIAPFTAYDGELHIIGRVVWIGRKA
jgi:phage repressor protein C with HTH and peptisase S24 domain